METTIFLAKLWGPVIIAFGLGVFISRAYYIKVYRDLEKSPLALLVFGMVAMTAGLAHIITHNVWGSLPEGLISFFGWALMIKGLLFIVYPNFVDKTGDWWAKNKLIPLAGTFCLIIGFYLSWLAYLS